MKAMKHKETKEQKYRRLDKKWRYGTATRSEMLWCMDNMNTAVKLIRRQNE